MKKKLLSILDVSNEVTNMVCLVIFSILTEILKYIIYINNYNMTSFKRFESKPVVKIILIYDWLNLWRHRQFITIFYQFLHIESK